MSRWLVLANLLSLLGCCWCSEVRHRSSGGDLIDVAAKPTIPEDASSAPLPPPPLDSSEAAAPTSTPRLLQPKAPQSDGVRRAARNRTQRMRSSRPLTKNEGGFSVTRSTTTATVDAMTTLQVGPSADNSAKVKPVPRAPAEEATEEASLVKSERNNSVSTTNPSQKNETADSPLEIRHSCSPECPAPRRSHPVRLSSPLAKLVLELSKPGAFEKGKSVFGDEPEMEATSCPPGDIGLSCRQAEARRGADECSGGNCEECRSCDEMTVTDWPHCCRENFHCCSQLALACQRCDKPALQVFCTKHFKRCS